MTTNLIALREAKKRAIEKETPLGKSGVGGTSGSGNEASNLSAQNTAHGTMLLHPLCELFPRMADADFASFKNDIAANGLHQPIVIHQGQILDGGNRYRACVELGIKPAAVEYSGTDPLGFVFSANARRRHLTPGQYAAIVAAAQNWELTQAPGSNQHVQKAAGPVTLPDLARSETDQAEGGGATLHHLNAATETAPLRTVSDRAVLSGASVRTQQMADKIARADPDLSRQVAHGEISLPQALRHVEKKPEPEKIAAPAPAIDPEPEDDLATVLAETVADLEREVAENRALQQRVDVLTASDQGAKLNEWITRYHQLEGRLQQALTTSKEAQSEATHKGKVLAAIRKFLGVERDSEILPKLKGGA